MCNSILLTLEALHSLLKETKTISKNLGKIRAQETERADQGEVTVDASGGRYRRFAADQRVDLRGRSLSTQREVAVGGSTAREGRHRRGWSLQEDQLFVNFFVVVKLREP